MYPILGSGDPKDEALAMQKHINLSNVMDSDEENEKEEAPKYAHSFYRTHINCLVCDPISHFVLF